MVSKLVYYSILDTLGIIPLPVNVIGLHGIWFIKTWVNSVVHIYFPIPQPKYSVVFKLIMNYSTLGVLGLFLSSPVM